MTEVRRPFLSPRGELEPHPPGWSGCRLAPHYPLGRLVVSGTRKGRAISRWPARRAARRVRAARASATSPDGRDEDHPQQVIADVINPSRSTSGARNSPAAIFCPRLFPAVSARRRHAFFSGRSPDCLAVAISPSPVLRTPWTVHARARITILLRQLLVGATYP